MSIEVALIDKLGATIKVSTTTEDSFCLPSLALLPHINLILSNARVKRNYSKLGELCEVVQLRVKGCKHPIIYTSRLVNGNSDLCLTTHPLAGVDTREPPVQLPWGCALISTLRSADEIT